MKYLDQGAFVFIYPIVAAVRIVVIYCGGGF